MAALTASAVSAAAALSSPVVSERHTAKAAAPLSASRSLFQQGASALRARGHQKCGLYSRLSRRAARVTCDVNRTTNLTEAVDLEQVKPQQDRVLVRLQEVAPVSAGGVLLPSTAAKFERYLVGEIIAKGPEASEVDVKQKVLFSDVQAYEVNLGTSSDRLCFCRAGDLLAVVET